MIKPPVKLIKPYISFDDVRDDFEAIFNSGTFTKGDYIRRFQDDFRAYVGCKHVFFATSATTALWVCLKLLGIMPGDEIIVSDFSFPATSNVVEDLGAVPVFADVSLETFNMLPEELEKKITVKTKAVIFVDALGNPSGLHAIKDICKAHGIPLIEDAACALGSSERGERCGSVADLTCFSFHPRKLLCTGEGGAITTESDDWAEWLNVKLNHGASGMHGMGLDFIDFGYNFRLPELQAAMGIRQMAGLQKVIESRQKTRQHYIDALTPLSFTAQQLGEDVDYNVQSIVFRVPENLNRNDLMLSLRDNGVETSIGTYALSAITYNRNKYASVQNNAETLFNTTITLPCYQDVDSESVIESIRSCIETKPRQARRS